MTISADLISGSAVGSGDVCVELPAPTGITLSPATANIAENSDSPVVSHLGYSTSRSLTVTVHYADGSNVDFTNDPRTSFSIITNPTLVNFTDNVIATADNGTGTSQVKVSIDFGGGVILEDTSDITVVGVDHIDLESYEIYTPSGSSVIEHTLSLIEGSATYQNSRLEVIEYYTNGTSKDITNYGDVSFTSSTPSIISFDGTNKWFVHAQSVGSTTLQAESGATGNYLSNTVSMTVNNNREDITSLTMNIADILGYKDTTTRTVTGYATFADGTRRYMTGGNIYQGDLIAGLLEFTSSDTSFGTIDIDSGVATLRGNGPTTITADINLAQDTGLSFSSWTKTIASNLRPLTGDVDLGNYSGLPHVSQGSGTIQVPIRLNTGSYKLGSFDIQVTFDPTKLQATSVVKGSGVSSFDFVGNPDYGSGTISAVGNETAPDATVQGSDVEVGVITFNVLSNPLGTTLSGTINDIYNGDGSIKFGSGAIDAGTGDFFDDSVLGALFITPPNSPSFASSIDDAPVLVLQVNKENILQKACNIARQGALELGLLSVGYAQTPSSIILGDANEDCALDSSDARFIQLYLANRTAPLSAYQQKMADAFPDGSVDISDTAQIRKTLAKTTHFIGSVTTEQINATDVKIIANIVDRDGLPVNTDVEVSFELTPDVAPIVADTPTGSGDDGQYSYTVTGLTGSGDAVVHLDVTTGSGETIAFNSSKITDPINGVFNPLFSYSVADAIVFGADYLACGVVPDTPTATATQTATNSPTNTSSPTSTATSTNIATSTNTPNQQPLACNGTLTSDLMTANYGSYAFWGLSILDVQPSTDYLYLEWTASSCDIYQKTIKIYKSSYAQNSYPAPWVTATPEPCVELICGGPIVSEEIYSDTLDLPEVTIINKEICRDTWCKYNDALGNY